MTQSLQIVLLIESTIGPCHNMIDIDTHHNLMLHRMHAKWIAADWIASQNHYTQ